MTTDIKLFENANLPTPEALVAALDNLKDSYGHASVAILKYDKTGRWVMGTDAELVGADSLWAINIFSFVHGLIAWGGDKTASAGKLLGESLVKMTEAIPDPGKAPEDATLGWQTQLGFSLKCLEGEDEGQEVRFITQSKGGVRAVAELIGVISQHTKQDPSKPFPVVRLVNYDAKNPATFYDHKNKSYSRVFVPVFDIVEWIGGPKQQAPAIAPVVEVAAEPPSYGEVAPDATVRRRRSRPDDISPF